MNTILFTKKDLSTLKSKSHQFSLLHIACLKNFSVEKLKFLLENNCSVNERSNKYQMNALQLRLSERSTPSMEMVRFLVEMKTDVNALDMWGCSGLSELFKKQKFAFEMAKFLIESKCEPICKVNKSESQINALCRMENVSLEMIKYFIEHKCDSNQKTVYEYVPLHMCCDNPNSKIELIRFFVERDPSSLNHMTRDSSTPLLLACRRNLSHEIIRYLVENKSDVNVSAHDMTPAYSLIHGDYRSLKYLVDMKSQIFLKDTSIYITEDYPEENFICLLSQPHHLYINNNNNLNQKLLSIFSDYICDNLWNPTRHVLFPLSIQQKSLVLVICVKIFSRSIKQIFPKPLILLILRLAFSTSSTSFTRRITIEEYIHRENDLVEDFD